MGQSPTASGKGVIAAHIARDILNRGRKVVIAVHRDELVEQTAIKFLENGVKGVQITRETWPSGSAAPSFSDKALIAMIQTLARRTTQCDIWSAYNEYDVMIFDEAHHSAGDGAWGNAVRQWPGFLLGLTATPWRLSTKEGFDKMYDDLYCGPGIVSLASDGYLAVPVVLQFNTLHGNKSLYVGAGKDSTGYEYSSEATWKANNNPILIEKALDWLSDVTSALLWWHKQRRVIIYCISQMHAKRVTAACKIRGIPVALLLDSTPTNERRKIIQGFRQGAITHLVNVNLVTEGIDVEDADCMLLLRPTKSLVVYMQASGRTFRRSDAPVALILDATDSTTELGHPLLQDLSWSLQARKPTTPSFLPVKHCLCGAACSLATQICPLCGEAFGKRCPTCGGWRSWNSIQVEGWDCFRCQRGRTAQLPSLSQVSRVTWLVSSNGNLWAQDVRSDKHVVIGVDKYKWNLFYLMKFQNKDKADKTLTYRDLDTALFNGESWLEALNHDRSNVARWLQLIVNTRK